MRDGEPSGGIPRATYRLQLNRAFTLRDATALVPYFAELGVSHLYCSPYMRARPESSHGYDVVDHNTLNPEIGTREDLEGLVASLRAHRMGHILDWVPNHVGIMGADNIWWMDVLENGPASIYAQFFDIAWENIDPALSGKVLVPVLGDHYGNTLERGELVLKFESETGSFAIFYHEHRFPVDPREYPRILERALAEHTLERLGEEERADFSSLIGAFGHLPDRRDLTPSALEERNRDKEVHKRRLVRLCGRSALLPEAVAAAVQGLNGAPGEPASFDALHELLEAQPYRLAYWRVAADEINYRRFFDINDLAALRMENEAVFDATHRLVLELIGARKVDGLRIDHPDGLYDPAQYFRRLQTRVEALRPSGPGSDPTAEERGAPRERAASELPLYLVVEKITARFEPLRDDWPVHGSTGYRFANVVSGVMVDSTARSRLDRIYRTFTRTGLEWRSIAHGCKRLVVETSLAAELQVLANELRGIARANRSTRDFTQSSLRQALAEIIACFPVYRTYIAASVSAEDRRYVDWAIVHARRRESGIDAAVFDFVRDILIGEGAGALPAVAAAARRFAMRLQQVTAPVTAKGVEDTALYRFDRLVSLNEVGGEPEHFGTSVREFHADARYRAHHWPHELLATSTHDTKRSEDVRSRINVLSEMPREWRHALDRWSRMNRPRRRIVDEHPAPSASDEYLLYQTLLGTFPLEGTGALGAEYVERIAAYLTKAVREAKVHSSWAHVNAPYEEAVQQFTREVLEPRPGNAFLADLEALSGRIARFGLMSSLSQTLCKLTAPGVPDIYQGTELWDFSLVDPDNRRPVDYARRLGLLREIRARAQDPSARPAYLRELLGNLADGRTKLYLIACTLETRCAHEALFARGAYVALRARGVRSACVIAFARRHAGRMALTVAPRLYARLLANGTALPLGAQVWGDTWIELPRGGEASTLRSILDGAEVRIREVAGRRGLVLGEVLAHFPVALLLG
jgi:(1->4)-alpha-D-glucan 1-alpha-D-glucosylmutase